LAVRFFAQSESNTAPSKSNAQPLAPLASEGGKGLCVAPSKSDRLAPLAKGGKAGAEAPGRGDLLCVAQSESNAPLLPPVTS
jgi:hypothetical protein